MKRWLAILALVPLGLLLILVFVVSTESGLRMALWPVKKIAPDLLAIESIDGKLLGPLDITGVSLSTSTMSLNMDSLILRWRPGQLLKRRLSVQKLAVDGVQITLSGEASSEKPAAGEPYALPERLALPISVDVLELSATHTSIRMTPDAAPQFIDVAEMQLQYDRKDDNFTSRAQIESPLLTANMSVNAETRNAYPIDGQIVWDANLPDLAVMNGNTSIGGTINSLTIVQQISSPYSLGINVTLQDVFESPSVDASASLAMDNAASIRADLPAIGVAGEVTFKGKPQNGELRSNLVFAGDLPGTVNSVIDASVREKLIVLNDLQLTVEDQPLTLNAAGSVDLSTTSPVADLNIQWKDLRWPLTDEPVLVEASGSAQLQGTPDDATINIDTSLNETGRVNGVASLRGSSIETAIDWHALQWPLDGSMANGITGGAEVSGQVDEYSLAMNTTIDTPQLSGVVLNATGTGTQKSIQIPSLNLLAADGGTLAADVQAVWAPAPAFAVTLDGSAFNPAIFLPEFPGNLNVSIKAEGEMINDTLQASVDSLNIEGEIRGQPLTLDSKAFVEGSALALETLTLNAGDTELIASGTVADSLELAFSVSSPDLSSLLPDAGGSINGEGRIGGTPGMPTIDVNLSGRSLRFADFALQVLDLDAAVDASSAGPVEVNLVLEGGTAGEIELESLNVTADGQMDAHALRLSGKTNQGDIDLALTGALADQRWLYEINESTLALPQFAPWRLVEPASGIISAETVTLSNACLGSADSKICLSMEKDAQSLRAQYDLSRFAIATLQPFLPDGLEIAGTIDSSGAVTLPTDSPLEGQFNAAMNSVTVDMDNSDGESVRLITLEPGELSGTIDSEGAQLNAVLDLGEQGKLQADVVATGTPDALMDASLAGRISGSLTRIDVIEQLVQTLEDVQGAVTADFKLSGSLREPLLTGEMALVDGNVSLADPGIRIQNAAARISANNSSRLGVAVTAQSGEGEVQIDGTVDIAATPVPAVSLALKGTQFQVINTLESEAALSPDLVIEYGSDGVVVSGDVQVPVLAITPKKVPSGVVAVSNDQLVVGQQTVEERAVPVDVRADVKIVFGEEVFVDAFGLNAALSGSLAVKEVPGNPTTATGQLEIEDGTFRAYGQNLVIQKGRIIYAGGPIDKPGFDIEAVRKVTSELQVGIRARGALANPQFSLFSDPAMSESEQMSYLVLGRPLQDNSPSENSAMRQAAMALGVAGGKLLTEKFGDKLGLDQVAIDSELRETGEQAALVVGKYLSPKLFVSYGIGLFEPVSTIKLDYSINRNVKLISETTESRSGGDIVFTFEGGK